VSLDVRAWVYCNLGTIISGSLQESSIVGAGLINVTGTLVLSGVYKIRKGDPVELAYYKNNRVARLGRKMRVLSSYANPAIRQTEVSIGCYLTYQALSAPPPRILNSTEDTSTPDLSGLAALLLIKPTSAKFVAETCCSALGLRHDPFPLTNQFYRDKFEINGPYLRILSDLLISENYVGYVDSTETLKLIDLNDTSGSGPVLNERNIVDVSPINSGEPDADVVYSVVQRKQIKLDYSIDANSEPSDPDNVTGEPDAEEIEDILERNGIPATEENIAIATGETEETDGKTPLIVNRVSNYWLSGYNTANQETAFFRYQPPKGPGDTTTPPAQEAFITYSPWTQWSAEYSGVNNQIRFRVEEKNGPWGITTTTVIYDSYKDGSGFEITTQDTQVVAPDAEVVLACGFPPEVLIPLPSNILGVSAGGQVRERVKTITVASDTSVITTEYRQTLMIFTADGAANIQKVLEAYSKRLREEGSAAVPLARVLSYARAFVSLPATVRFATKAPQTSLSSAFSAATADSASFSDTLSDEEKTSLISQELEAEGSGTASVELDGGSTTGTIDQQVDPKAGYTAEVFEVPEIIYTKNTPGGIFLEFTPPYLSDDKLSKSGDKYVVTPSDAAEKAKAFADRQNKLRFGKRNGQSIVFPVEYLPIRPYSPVYLEFLGVVGQYRTDNVNVVFDSTGILVSADTIFLGGVGQ
jgi:hypothetical protein